MPRINTAHLVNLATDKGRRATFVIEDDAVQKAGKETIRDAKQFGKSLSNLTSEAKSAWDRSSSLA